MESLPSCPTGGHGGPPGPKPATGIGWGVDPTPGVVTLGLAGTQSAAGGFARIGPCTGSPTGLVSAWILTWIGQQLDSHLGLVSAWILTWDWSVHGFLDGIGQSSDSHMGLARAGIPAQDWSVHRFSHGTGQQMDCDMGSVGAWVLLWDWPARGPIRRQVGCLGPIASLVWDPAPQIPSAPCWWTTKQAPSQHSTAQRSHCRLWAAPWHQRQPSAPGGAITHLKGW